ncbi:vacuolar protein sorting/targeting protein PEP1 [Entophlyctis luteolus]|nr:vacuolar protein sorting/targeting protein PEP1 [Entophlyctis luteolus]
MPSALAAWSLLARLLFIYSCITASLGSRISSQRQYQFETAWERQRVETASPTDFSGRNFSLAARSPQSASASSDARVSLTTLDNDAAVLVNFEDSDVIDASGAVYISRNEGKDWNKLSELAEPVVNVIVHPFAKNLRAFAITEGKKHYFTKDAGISWNPFEISLPLESDPGFSFHSIELDWIIFRGLKMGSNDGWFDSFSIHSFYTKDSFKSFKPLLEFVTDCIWANSVKLGGTLGGKPVAPKDKVFCLQWDESQRNDDVMFRDPHLIKLVYSDSFFPKEKGTAVNLDGYPIAIGSTQTFLVAIAGSPSKEGRVDLYSCDDGINFSKADFPKDASILDSFTLLDSSENRILVDIIPILSSTGSSAPFGNLYVSNSAGNYFTISLSHTNHDESGRVDFERIESEIVSGTLLANVVENWKEVESDYRKKKLISSRISFDDGARWNLIRPPEKDVNGESWKCKVSTGAVDSKCSLHFHSQTEFHNLGRTFSTLSAPGILIGVGNVGDHLLNYDESDTFLSSDGGITWQNIVRGPHKYEIADMGSLIVLVPDSGVMREILFSTKRGAVGTWNSVTLPSVEQNKWKPVATSIDPDSTSSQMIIIASSDSVKKPSAVFHVDFSKVHSRKCDFDASNPSNSKDFELYTPKKPTIGGSATDACILGEDVGYFRRKQDADCYVGRKFKHPEIKRKTCECSEDDFECDFGFRLDETVSEKHKCIRYGRANDQPAECPIGTQYDGLSGFRKIPGNKCKGGKTLDAKVKVDCKKHSSVAKPPGKDPVVATPKAMKDKIEKLLYLRQSSVVLLLTHMGFELLRSEDEGITWKEVDFFKDKYPILLLGQHDADPKRAYIVTETKVYYSKDNFASNPTEIQAPSPFNKINVQILDYHPTEADYLVFVGYPNNCQICYTQVYLTFDSGKTWLNDNKPVETWATRCVWAWDKAFGEKGHNLGKDAVLCASYKNKNGKISQEILNGVEVGDNALQLVLITNKGKDREVLIDHGVMTFYVVDSVLVVLMDDGASYKLKVSTDEIKFLDTQFPPKMDLDYQGFTVFESETNGIFLDVAQNLQMNAEFGHLFKSNSDGTQYSRIMPFSNRNRRGIVDFERMKGVPGVLLVNTVQNPRDISSKKHISTKISFDDGSTWKSIKPPSVDVFGEPISCGSDEVNVFSIYSELSGSFDSDKLSGGKSSIHSSSHAAGIMLAVGSVGERLEEYAESNMYLTKDAGRTWTEVHKDAHKWAFGDHGAMIVMINDETETSTLIYSWDYGESWAEFKFSEKPIRVSSVQSEPSATSLKFIITGNMADQTFVIGVDFAEVLPRACGKPSKTGTDFVQWTPASDEGKDRCFLGQDLAFWRRKEDVNCYIGKEFEYLPVTSQVCECTDDDFECDFHFYRNDANECVPYGVDPLQPANCKPGEKYKGSSGYRKIPLSKCTGGKDRSAQVDRICGEADGKPGQVKITANMLKFQVSSYFFFNQTSTIVMHDESGRIYVSDNGGQAWAKPELKDPFSSILLDQYRPEKRAFFLRANSANVTWTEDVAKSFYEMTVPTKPNRFGISPLVFHYSESSYLIWIGEQGCENKVSPNCRAVAYLTKNSGKSWKEIVNYVHRCAFPKEALFTKPSKDTILCQVFNVKSGNQVDMGQKTSRKLIRSTDLGANWDTVLNASANFATSGKFMVAAELEQTASEMKMFTSTDSFSWTHATFEEDEKIPDYGYTLLESPSETAFVEVFSKKDIGAESGTLYKSFDSDAKYFKISLRNVNQDEEGYTDFEKILGIEGIAIANFVVNADQTGPGISKKIRTVMTYNDGNLWKTLKAPKERNDQNDMFSSAGAVGFMMGVGNVGESLTERKYGGTFLTRDAGHTWTEIASDAYQFEFGDNGGIILIANDEIPTDEIQFSLNYGQNFDRLKITDELSGGKLRVRTIISEPHGSTSSFVVFGVIHGGSHDSEIAAIHLNFQNVWSRVCSLDKNNQDKSDFEPWSPSGEKSDDESCILGRETQYFRRKADRECHSKGHFEPPVTLTKTCLCTVDDFTCDVGYSRDSSNNCVINPGYVALEPACVGGKRKYSTGYIKVRGSKCEGGLTLDVGKVEYCASVLSLAGWIGIFAVVLGIPAIVSFTVIHMKRGGRIRLPVDDDVLDGAIDRASDLSGRAAQVVRTSLILFMGIAEIGLSKVGEIYDWARTKYNQRVGGYSALQTNYYDVDLEPDSTLLFDDD